MQHGSWDTEVEARIAGTHVRVLSFTWQGRRLPVVGNGRAWADDAGRHFLVMAPGDAIFELCEDPAGVWHVLRASERRHLV